MKNVKTGINGRPDPVVLQVADSIIAGATGKPELANAPVTLVELGTQRETASDALTDEVQAKEAWLMNRTARQDAFKALRTSVRRYALHANSVYMDDRIKLQALGLDIVDSTGVVGVLPAPSNLRSRPGKLDGTVRLIWRAVRGRDFYVLECAESAAGPWQEAYRGNDANVDSLRRRPTGARSSAR